MPVLGEWYALPLIATAGSTALGDETFNKIFHPSSIRLLDYCNAVLRVGGPSQGGERERIVDLRTARRTSVGVIYPL